MAHLTAFATSISGCSCGASPAPPVTVAVPAIAEGESVELPPTESSAQPASAPVGYTAFVVEGFEDNGVGLAITDDALVLMCGNQLVAIAGDGTTRIVENPEGFDSYDQRDQPATVAAGAFAYFRDDGRLVAREVSSLATRFVFPLEDDALDRPSVFASGDLFVVVTATTWFGIDARTGAEVWRTALTAPITGTPQVYESAGPGVLVEARRGFVLGLDPRTGREIFRRESTLEEPGPVSPHGFGLRFFRDLAALTAREYASQIASQPPYVETIVGLDGRDLARIETGAYVVRDTVEVGERSTTLVTLASGDVSVRTYAHEGARMTWSAGPFASSSGTPSLARGGDRLVLLSDLHTVRVLDAAGHDAWRGQPRGECTRVATWTPAGATEPWIACVGLGNVSLYRPTAPVPRRTLHVSGTLRCDGRPLDEVVFVGGTRVETDAEGHYETDVVVDEELMIGSRERPNGAGCGPAWDRIEVAPGATDARADLNLPEWIGGFDGL